MGSSTSIGPADSKPKPDEDRLTRATVEGVDAQNANEFDMQHGLAGAEIKQFSDRSRGGDNDEPEARDHEAFSSQPEDDPNRRDPNERTDTIGERKTPGLHGGGGSPAR